MTVASAIVPLKRSKDRKVSTFSSGKPNDLRAQVGNSFGLPAMVTCPGSTESCRSACYAFKLERAWTSVGRVMQSNLDSLLAADGREGMAALLGAMIDEFRTESARVSKRAGRDLPLEFRLHWNGDFYSETYAEAWADVIRANPDIQFWAYTRSFVDSCDVVPILVDLPNLALYLSVDPDNVELAGKASVKYPGVRLALLGDTFEEAKQLFDAPAAKCPENAKRVPLVAASGEGACIKCGLCPLGKKNVLFSASHK